MLRVCERLPSDGPAELSLTLAYEQRQKSRQRVRLDCGDEIGLFLAPGTVLRDGDRLAADNGHVIRVHAAPERVSTAQIADAEHFARVCYHLGNRHIPVQIGAGWLRYLHDPVLDELLAELEVRVVTEEAPFEPEGGAYPHRA